MTKLASTYTELKLLMNSPGSILLPKITSRDLVLMARHYSAILRRHATPLGFEIWNGPVALQVR
jgi:hypothetical protein